MSENIPIYKMKMTKITTKVDGFDMPIDNFYISKITVCDENDKPNMILVFDPPVETGENED